MARVSSRRKVLIAIIALLGILVLSMLTGCSQVEPQFDLVKNRGEYGDMVFENMQDLADNYTDRSMGTEWELKAAHYIADKLSSFGYTSEYSSDDVVGLQRFRINHTRYDGTNMSDIYVYNVIFTKKAAGESKGVILLSTQYDNLYQEKTGGETWKADGSYESGSGTATLLAIAELMKDFDCSYDVTFAFFTGGSYGWQGASQYVANLKNDDREKIKLNIDLSMLGGGDNLYLYSGEYATYFGGYMRSASDGLTPNPKDKNVAPFIMENNPTYAFSNIGMIGNQYFLMNRNVPTVSYKSHNWSCNENPFMTEMQGKANVYHTQNDTLATMIERKGEEGIKSMLNDVVNSVLNALSKDNEKILDGALTSSNNQVESKGQNSQASSMTSIAIKLVTVAIFFGIALTVRNYIRKNRHLYFKQQPVEQDEVKPFDFDTYPKKDDNKDDEDFDEGDGKNQPYDPFV